MVLVYSTCLTSAKFSPEAFRQKLTDVARWVEGAGLHGMLVFTDNNMIDSWAAAQHIIERTEHVVPLVAVQPMYMHPYNAARMVSTLAYLYGRQVDLNFVTGGSRAGFRALGSTLDHDERYQRLIEFGEVVGELLSNAENMTYEGIYYQLTGASLRPEMAPGLLPVRYVAGSSPACLDAARALDAVRLMYPLPVGMYDTPLSLSGAGIRLGVIARGTGEEAWRVAHRRFPPDRIGEARAAFFSRGVESQWWHRLLRESRANTTGDPVYWLYPFRSYKTFCPYLVGSYAEVGYTLSRYLGLGASTIILGEPWSEDDLYHTQCALQHMDQAQYTR